MKEEKILPIAFLKDKATMDTVTLTTTTLPIAYANEVAGDMFTAVYYFKSSMLTDLFNNIMLRSLENESLYRCKDMLLAGYAEFYTSNMPNGIFCKDSLKTNSEYIHFMMYINKCLTYLGMYCATCHTGDFSGVVAPLFGVNDDKAFTAKDDYNITVNVLRQIVAGYDDYIRQAIDLINNTCEEYMKLWSDKVCTADLNVNI